MDAIAERWRTDAVVEPNGPGSTERIAADALHAQWLRAVERSRHWADH
jgi:glycerol kinase